MTEKNLQLVQPERTSTDSPPLIAGKIPKVRSLKQAKRLMSKLISSFVAGEISANDSKTLAYLVSTFIEVAGAADIEQRLDDIEQRLGR